MANNWQINAIAGLDGTQSRNQLNSDIKGLARNLDKLKLYTEIDKNQVIQLQNQLKKLQIYLNTVTVTDAAINGLVQKINDGLKNIQISNINVGNIGNQAQQVGQQIGNNIGQQITQSISSAIQKGTMKSADGTKDLSKYIPNGKLLQNDVAKQALKDFQALGVGIVTVKEEMKNIDGKNLLNGFTINIKNAKGEVESLRYALTDIEGKTGKMFQYVGGSINDNGVIKQMNTISAKADSLQTKLEKLKSSYSDMNASRPIKDSNNISALSQQYDKVAKSIENVRNADSASFSSMVSNAQREITVLENMVSQFRNAENVATQMKSVDISSGIAQAQERLGKLKANASGFDQMKQTIVDLDTAIANVGDKSSLDAFINKLKVAESQLGRVKAETKQLQDVNKIQLSFDTGSYQSKVDSLVARTNQWVDANGNARISTESLQTALNNLGTAYTNLNSSGGNTVANQQALIEAEKALDTEIKKVQSSVTSMNATMAKSSAVDALRQKVQYFYDINTATHGKWGNSLKNIMSQLASGTEVPIAKLKELERQFITIQNTARQAGKLGLSFFDTMKQGMQKFSYWTSSTFLVMKTITSIKSAVSSVKELDTSLVDLKKTTSMTASQLEEFYYTANDVAKQMGVTTKEIIDQASAWSRLGYSSQEVATKMAKLSSMFASISPGMDVDTATDGLVSIMKAFDIGNDNPDDVLDGIMSKVNIIGNTAATSNAEIVNMLSKSSSAMKEANNTLEETIALETAAVEITRDDDSVGTAFKTLSMRIRGRQTLPPYTVMYMLCA